MPKDTYIPRNEALDINKAFNKVRKQAEEELMKLPGVVAVGVGLKEIGGEINRIPCFKVTVELKKPKSEIKNEQLIPDEIFGFKTDVNEIMVSRSGANPSKYRPLMGGSQIEPSGASRAGTLGCFAKRNSDNKIVLLSNWHVMVEKKDTIDNDRVGQPTHNGCCSCCATNEIAKVTDGRFLTDDMDAAIALLNGQDGDAIPDDRFLNEILEIGALVGGVAPQPVPTGGGNPVAFETVYQYGRTSGLTKGQIINDNTAGVTIYKEYDQLSVSRNGIVAIQPLAPFVDYFVEGDSGSVSVNELNQVVALNYAFTNLHFTFAKNIVTVANTLGITILDSSFHGSVAGKEGVLLRSSNTQDTTSLKSSFAELETELANSGEGMRLLQLFKIHREELLYLVRNKREVMVAWKSWHQQNK